RRFVVVWVAVAIKIPGGIDERIHRVGFAPRRTAAFRAGGVDEFGSCSEWRAAFTGELGVFRKDDGQVLVGYRDNPIFVAVDDGDRRAPVTLAGNAPIAEAISRFSLTEALGLSVRSHGQDGFVRRKARVRARID